MSHATRRHLLHYCALSTPPLALNFPNLSGALQASGPQDRVSSKRSHPLDLAWGVGGFSQKPFTKGYGVGFRV